MVLSQSRLLKAFFFLGSLSAAGCRVVDAPIEVAPANDSGALASVVRDGLEPSLRTMTSALGTIGVAYRASLSLAGQRVERSDDGRLLDGSNLFMPSPEDEIALTQIPEATALALSDNVPPPGTTSGREIYDFSYSLTGSRTMSFPDPTLKLKVEATGRVEVVNGKPEFLNIAVSADVFSNAANDPKTPVAKFKIANLAVIGKTTGQRFQVSFTEYRRLVQYVNSTTHNAIDFDSGSLEIIITKEEATLTVSNLLLDPKSNLKFDTISAQWNYDGGFFTTDAKLSFEDSNHEKFGIDLSVSRDAEVTTKLWKRLPEGQDPPSALSSNGSIDPTAL